VNSVFGQLVSFRLSERVPTGHEQTGLRPCLLIADLGQHQRLNYPMLLVAPITSTMLQPGLLRIRLEAGWGGLEQAGTILLDQLTSVDVSRLRGSFGSLTEEQLVPVRTGLTSIFQTILE
jgi:mRNA-degrading endonuclease toxin of MazEF toxin-antitoxin module